MGRLAHILRVALGRSYDLPPNWDELSDQYKQVSSDPILYMCVDDSNPNSVGKFFDVKGRPFSPYSRDSEREQERAQNAALAIALTTSADAVAAQHDNSIQIRDTDGDVNDATIYSKDLHDFRDAMGAASRLATALDECVRLTVTWPFSTIAGRVLLYNSSDSITLLQRIVSETRHLGLLATFFPGFVCGCVAFCCEEAREKLRAQLLTLSTWRDVPPAIWHLHNVLWLWTSTCMSSLIHYSTLQSMHLIPSESYLPRRLPLSLLARSQLYAIGVFINPVVSFVGTSVAGIVFNRQEPSIDPDGMAMDASLLHRIRSLICNVQKMSESVIGRITARLSGRPLDRKAVTRYPIHITQRTVVCISYALLFPLPELALRVVARTFLDSADSILQKDNAAWFSQFIFGAGSGRLGIFSGLMSATSTTQYLRRLSTCFCLWTSGELLVLAAQNQIWLWRYRAWSLR